MPPFSAMWVASLSRCRSPPDSVVSGWPRLREPSPASARAARRAEAEVAAPDGGEPVEDGVRGRRARVAGAEERLGLGHGHREHLADVTAAEMVFEHRCLDPLSLALLAGGGYAGHHRQVGVDDAGAVAVGAGAFRVGTEQRRPHALGP